MRGDDLALNVGGLLNLGGFAYLINFLTPSGEYSGGTPTSPFEPHPDFTPKKPEEPEPILEPIPEPTMLERLGQWWDETLYDVQKWLVEKAIEHADTINAIIEFFSW